MTVYPKSNFEGSVPLLMEEGEFEGFQSAVGVISGEEIPR